MDSSPEDFLRSHSVKKGQTKRRLLSSNCLAKPAEILTKPDLPIVPKDEKISFSARISKLADKDLRDQFSRPAVMKSQGMQTSPINSVGVFKPGFNVFSNSKMGKSNTFKDCKAGAVIAKDTRRNKGIQTSPVHSADTSPERVKENEKEVCNGRPILKLRMRSKSKNESETSSLTTSSTSYSSLSECPRRAQRKRKPNPQEQVEQKRSSHQSKIIHKIYGLPKTASSEIKELITFEKISSKITADCRIPIGNPFPVPFAYLKQDNTSSKKIKVQDAVLPCSNKITCNSIVKQCEMVNE